MENINDFCPACLPPIYNIHRWWNPSQADFLARLKTAIKHVADKEVSQLLTIAFCRILIEFSNAAFNHIASCIRGKNFNKVFQFRFIVNIVTLSYMRNIILMKQCCKKFCLLLWFFIHCNKRQAAIKEIVIQ